MSQLIIRPFERTDKEYEDTVAVWNNSWPQWMFSAEETKKRDDRRSPDSFWGKAVGEVNGRIVAYANYGEVVWSKKPGKYAVYVIVLPQFRNQGIGTALYDHVFSTLQQREQFTILVTDTLEDQTNTLESIRKRGFTEMMRYPISELDVTAFDADRFIPKMEQIITSGIELCTVSELKSRDADWMQRIYEMECEIDKDIPSPDPVTSDTFEQYQKMLNDPSLLHDGFVVAVDNGNGNNAGRYVGLSALWKSATQPEKLYTGLTGVLRSHRRRGLATAMKTKAILYARSRGVTCIETDNEENNPMFQINMQLGFKPLPAALEFHKKIKGRNHEPPNKD